MPPRPPLTHFLCIPLVTESSRAKLQASIQHFTSDISSATNPNHPNSESSPHSSTNPSAQDGTADPTPLFHPSAIRPLTTLHLTLGVMAVPTPTRLAAATTLLSSIDLSRLLGTATSPTRSPSRHAPQTPNPDPNTDTDTDTEPHISAPSPLTLSLHSLHPLPTAQNASILYATPHDVTGRLYPFCTALRSVFEEAGFILAEKRELLLHCTIVNTVYARDGSGRWRGRGGKRRDRGQGKFDARELVGKYEGFEWMQDCRVERVGICEMGATEVGGEVRYVEVVGREMP